jgi:hypothetical protein
MKSAVIIVPTTGSAEVAVALDSCLRQTRPAKILAVVDGPEFEGAFRATTAALDPSRFTTVVLPENVGRDGFYGHRIYAGFTHLVNADYVLYLDQDNWFEPDHVETMLATIESSNLEWCYGLRNVTDKSGTFLLRDDCESLGRWPTFTNTHHVDTSSYALTREVAIRIASFWHGGWGQDRIVLTALSQNFRRYDCSGRYTTNYRLNGNPGSVTKEFFERGNAVMKERFPGGFPWTKG